MGRIIKTRRGNKQVKKEAYCLFVFIYAKKLLKYGKNKKQKSRICNKY